MAGSIMYGVWEVQEGVGDVAGSIMHGAMNQMLSDESRVVGRHARAGG
jgi:hypothetical protein